MFRTAFFVGSVAAAFGLCACGFWFGRAVPFAQQWPLFEALRNTASIIFAVVGAWLAIIYPERLKMSFGKPSVGAPAAATGNNVSLLMLPAVHSTILLAILLLIGVIAPMLQQIPVLLDHVEVLRGLSYTTVVGLTCWQVAIVVMTLFPADVVQDAIAREQATADIRSQRGKLRR